MPDASIIQEFAKWGVFGILFLFALAALRAKDADLAKSHHNHNADLKANAEKFAQAVEINTKATEAAARGFEAMAKSHDQLKLEIAVLSEKITANKVRRR